MQTSQASAGTRDRRLACQPGSILRCDGFVKERGELIELVGCESLEHWRSVGKHGPHPGAFLGTSWRELQEADAAVTVVRDPFDETADLKSIGDTCHIGGLAVESLGEVAHRHRFIKQVERDRHGKRKAILGQMPMSLGTKTKTHVMEEAAHVSYLLLPIHHIVINSRRLLDIDYIYVLTKEVATFRVLRCIEEGEQEMATDPIVEAEGLVKLYKETRALDGLSLSIEPGIVYGLLGPNGAGKTTFINVATTLLRPDSGWARIDGLDVQLHGGAVRQRIGLAGQFAAVDGYLTGRENVEMIGRLYGLSATKAKRRADDILERIGLVYAGDKLVRTYSGGMRRRLDLAASLVGRPKVLFLDEPTTGLDPRSRLDLWGLIEEFVEDGSTILLTTQYLDEADRLATRIGVIDQGRMIEEGTANELKDRFGASVVEIKLQPDDTSRALDALGGMEGSDPQIDEGTGSIRISASEGSRTLVEVVRRLDASDVPVEDIALHRPNLDEVFLSLTGRSAEQAEQERERKPKRRSGGRAA